MKKNLKIKLENAREREREREKTKERVKLFISIALFSVFPLNSKKKIQFFFFDSVLLIIYEFHFFFLRKKFIENYSRNFCFPINFLCFFLFSWFCSPFLLVFFFDIDHFVELITHAYYDDNFCRTEKTI